MNRTTITRLVGTLVICASAAMLEAQSSDALLKKLVSKGILTTQEADELKKESEAGFDKAYRAKTGLPDWVTSLKIYGDLRGRYEFFHTDNDAPGAAEPNKDRTRFRYRLRTGMTATFKDNLEMGFRLASGEQVGAFGGDPISPNATMQDNGSKKYLWIDLAYGKWTPINTGPWLLSGTVGKMENPFLVSDMVFDPDYTPEGAAIQGGYTFNDAHSIKWNGAVFVLDEINQGSQASNDPLLFGLQWRYDAKWTPKLTSSIALGWYALSEEENLGNGAVPNINVGNTRYATAVPGSATKVVGALVNNYDPVVVDAAVTYTLDSFPCYVGKFPIRLAGEYMNNPGASSKNEAYWIGLFAGKAAKKGTWEASYRYKRLEADAWYEEFVDSDFGAYYQAISAGAGLGTGYRAGTGIKGHIFRLAYSPADAFQLGATYFLTDLIDEPLVAGKHAESGEHRLQIDAMWKF